MKGKKVDMISRPFLDIGVATKEENSQQYSKGKLQESKSTMDMIESKKQKICTNREVTELEAPEKAIPRWLSNEVTTRSSSFNVDEASETMSMIKKARVSVRARSVSSMVSM